MPSIDHLFVLMLENRSFDHMFGLSGLPGIQVPGNLKAGAKDRAKKDPSHDFPDVDRQYNAGHMDGFDSGADAYLGLEPAQIPVLTALAREFLLFDNWYSSMPGPTWPNRFAMPP